jgi:cystathionine gamma-synthase
MASSTRSLRPSSLAAAGPAPDPHTGSVSPAIHPSTTFARDAAYALLSPDRDYTRDRNPTYLGVEEQLRALEDGAGAMLFSSGMAAATAVFQTLAPGDHVVAPRSMYFGLRKWLTAFTQRWGVGLDSYVNDDLDGLAAAIRPGKTKLVWAETPANPTWEVTDLAAAADLAHRAGARLAVDSTVATPVLTRPIGLGADLVMHSATKYLNGHGDVLGGVLVTAKLDDPWVSLGAHRHDAGAVLGPFEAWLLGRGLRTLFLRVERASDTALSLARRLAEHPAIASVLYPGLPSHPNHAVATRQMDGRYGGMLSILVRGGAPAALAVAGRLQLFVRATSLGGVESLVEHRLTAEGPTSVAPPELLRLSVGLEDPDDLWEDLAEALVSR